MYFFSFLITSVPLIIFILIIETTYLIKLLDFSKYVISNKEKIKNILIFILYLDFITWPVYNATLNPFYSFNLILASIGILYILTYIDDYVGVFNEKQRKNLRSISFLTIGILFSFDIYILLGFIFPFYLFLNLSIALFTFTIFLGIIIKPFKEHSLIAFAFWGAIFILLSSIIYNLSSSWEIGVTILIITFVIYPFVFLMEELRELFNKFVDIVIKAFKKFKLLLFNFVKKHFNVIWTIISAFIGIFIGVLLSPISLNYLNWINASLLMPVIFGLFYLFFLRKHYQVIWTIISAFIGIFIGVLLSPISLNYLNWIHASLLMFAIFGLLYLILPATQTNDPDIIFKRRILRLSIGWGSVLGLLFNVITPEWYIFASFISTAVIGTIILVFLGRKEEREKISVKWRFYTLLILFILIILFGVLSFIQLSTINF